MAVYYAKKPLFIDVTAVRHLPECSMAFRVQWVYHIIKFNISISGE